MIRFKQFLLEQNQAFTNPQALSLYRALVSAEHRGVVKDPTKYDEKLYVRTRAKPKDPNVVSTAYGPGQITLTLAQDVLKRGPKNTTPEFQEYLNKFIEQGKKMKSAKPGDQVYDYGCYGDLCGEEYHEPYEQLAAASLALKGKDANVDFNQPLNDEQISKVIQRWRGVPEEQDKEYYKIVRDRFAKFNSEQQPQQQQPVAPKDQPVQATQQVEVPEKSTEELYTVKSGDSISKIAKGDQKMIDAIVAANSIKDPNKIYAGQKLKIPTR